MELKENQKFRDDNTEGFDDVLAEMNTRLQELMEDVDEEDPNFEQKLKTRSEEVFNEYC